MTQEDEDIDKILEEYNAELKKDDRAKQEKHKDIDEFTEEVESSITQKEFDKLEEKEKAKYGI